MKITQKELVMRLLAQNIGKWHSSFDLVQKAISGGFTGITPMERLYEIIRDGGEYQTGNATYILEHRKIRKYAEFRIAQRVPKNTKLSNSQMIDFFNSYTPA